MVLLAAEHWLVGSDKYRLQDSQMNIIACSCTCQYGEKGHKVVFDSVDKHSGCQFRPFPPQGKTQTRETGWREDRND